MSERQNDMPKDRQTERQIEDKTTFQPSYKKKRLFRMSRGCQKDRKTGGQTSGQTDR